MTGRSVHVTAYRHITKLYPAPFRHEYGADLVTLFADQIDDESPARVWARTLRDLAVSVPTQCLEPYMKRLSTPFVTAGSGLVAVTAALLALVVGTGPAMPAFFVVALFSGATAVWSWQANQPVRNTQLAGRSWWKVLLAGPALAALTFIAMAIPWPEAVDLGDNAYWLVVIAFMTSIVLAGSGLILGIVAAVERHGSRGPSPA